MANQVFRLEEFEEKIEDLFQSIAKKIPDLTQEAAATAKGMIRDRIQQRGLDAEEQALAAYSPAYRKRKEERYGAESVEHTNLTATGRMWTDIKVQEGKATEDGYVAILAASSEENDEKASYNSKRYGDILRVTQQEEETLAEDLDAAIQEIIDESGF